jgi:hypothetical protein
MEYRFLGSAELTVGEFCLGVVNSLGRRML